MKKTVIIFGVLRLVSDFLITIVAFIIAREIRTHTDLIPFVQLPIGYIPSVAEYIPFVLGVSFLFVFVLAINGLYSFKQVYKQRQVFVRIFFLSVAWIMLIISYFFLRRDFFFSRLVLLYAWVLTVILVLFSRTLIHILQGYLLKKGVGKTNILFIGDTNLTMDVSNRFVDNVAYHVVGVAMSKPIRGRLTITNLEELDKICSHEHVEEIMHISSLSSTSLTSADILEYCRVHHLRYRFIPDILDVQRTNVEIWEEEGFPIIELKPTRLDGWGRVMKRVFDIVISSLALILLSPVFLIIAIAIKCDSSGPILFRQMRVGVKGKEFLVLKFRTMIKNAEILKQQLIDKNERKDGPLFKLKNDPRITRLGRFLRRTSLDELPQLLNIFCGQMSLVGPRPHLPSEVAQYEKHHKLVLSIKPGLTGMGQVNGRSGLSFDEEVRFDLYYIQNWSLFLDMVILYKTFLVVLKRENAD